MMSLLLSACFALLCCVVCQRKLLFKMCGCVWSTDLIVVILCHFSVAINSVSNNMAGLEGAAYNMMHQ